MKSSLLILSVLATVAIASFPSRFLQETDPPLNETNGNQTEPAYCIPEEELLAMLGPN